MWREEAKPRPEPAPTDAESVRCSALVRLLEIIWERRISVLEPGCERGDDQYRLGVLHTLKDCLGDLRTESGKQPNKQIAESEQMRGQGKSS